MSFALRSLREACAGGLAHGAGSGQGRKWVGEILTSAILGQGGKSRKQCASCPLCLTGPAPALHPYAGGGGSVKGVSQRQELVPQRLMGTGNGGRGTVLVARKLYTGPRAQPASLARIHAAWGQLCHPSHHANTRFLKETWECTCQNPSHKGTAWAESCALPCSACVQSRCHSGDL